MESISKIKRELKEAEDLMLSLKKREEEKKNELLLEILNQMITSKFVVVSFDGHKNELWYCYSLIPNTISEINGVKISKEGRIEYGKLKTETLIYAENLETIDPSVFFNKLDELNCNFDFNESYILKECFSYKKNFEKKYSKKKAVAYCRLSQKGGKNGYNRQISIINKKFTDYNVCEFFKETVSGTTSLKERYAIKDLVAYCNYNNIETLVISELARLGRKSNVILDGIGFLRKNGIKEIYVLFEGICINEDYIIDNNSELKILAEFCEKDRKYINERFTDGGKAWRDYCKENGIKMGRPKGSSMTDEKYLEKHKDIVDLLSKGISIRKTGAVTGKSPSTVKRVSAVIKKANKEEQEG